MSGARPGREYDYPVGVADHDVAGLDGHAGAGHGDAGLPGDVTAAEDGRVDGGVVDGDLEAREGRAVADRAVGDDAGRAADLGAQREDVADRARGVLAAGLDDQHLTRADLLDGAFLGVHPGGVGDGQVLAQREVADRPGVAGHRCLRPGRAEPVQGEAVQAALAELGGHRRGGYLA